MTDQVKTLKEYIEQAEKVMTSQVNLAKLLNVDSSYLRNSKRGHQALPVALCMQIADIIKVEKVKVIAASNLLKEKDPQRRKILEKCLSTAASIVFVLNMNIVPEIKSIKEILHNVNYTNITQNFVSKYTL